MTSIVSNGSLIKKVYFPRMTLPLAAVGSFGFTWVGRDGRPAHRPRDRRLQVLVVIPLIALTMVFLAMFAPASA